MPKALKPMPVVLSIAGFDPSSGAGVTADLKTIAAHGCYGTACITALTVQSTRGVSAVHPLEPALVSATLSELWADLPPAAIRIGMLGSSAIGEAVARFLHYKQAKNVVLDPILSSSSGVDLAGDGTIEVLKNQLFPLATLITPNLPEALALTGTSRQEMDDSSHRKASLPELARQLRRLGVPNVAITGGHLPENSDFLLSEDGLEHWFEGKRVDSRSTHGTGCAYAAAITCNLALGMALPGAVRSAKHYVSMAIQRAPGLGQGKGPLDHLWPLREKSK